MLVGAIHVSEKYHQRYSSGFTILPENKCLWPVVTQCISLTDHIYCVHQEPNHQKVASIWAYMCSIHRVHSDQSLCPSIAKFTDLICLVHQDPSRQKVPSIWAYMGNILRVHSKHSLCPSIPIFTDLICSVHKDPSRQKVNSIWDYMIYVQWTYST